MAYTFACLGMRQIAQSARLFSPAMNALGHSRPGRASSKSGHVRYAAESGSKFRALAARRRTWFKLRTGASNHTLRTQRLWMHRHQADAAEQDARRSACKWPSRAQWHLLGPAFRCTVARPAGELWATHAGIYPNLAAC